MAFGRPTRYLQVDLQRIPTAGQTNHVRAIWDKGVEQASDEYKNRMVSREENGVRRPSLVPGSKHNLFCDNCHSHVALALNTMNYDRRSSYNMVTLCFWMFFRGKFVR